MKYRVCDTCQAADGEYRPHTPTSWLCSKCRVYETCTECARPVRPYQTLAKDHPGTLCKARTNPDVLCTACYGRAIRSNVTPVPTVVPSSTKADVTDEQRTATLELLAQHEALDLADMLGLD